MAKQAPAPYLFALQPALEAGLLRSTRHGLLLEVHNSVSIQTSDKPWKVQPGQVLHPIWRQATPSDIQWWKATKSQQLISENVHTMADKTLQIRIVEVVDDLPATLRQHARHIPATLVGRQVLGNELPGDFDLTGDKIRRLTALMGELAGKRRFTPSDIAGFNREMAQIHEELLRARSAPKIKAREEIAARLSERPDVKLPADAMGHLLVQQQKDVRIALAVLDEAMEILRIYNKIHRGFTLAFKQLVKQLQRLEGSDSLRTANSVAEQAANIHANLTRVATFNPFYERVHSSEVARLQDSDLCFPDYLGSLRRKLLIAVEKLSVLVEGKLPNAQEIAAARRRLQ